MIRNEKGFSIIELVVGIALTALISLGGLTVTYQTLGINDRTQNAMMPVMQVASAGYWIARDVQISESIITTDLPSLELIEINWTEWVLNEDSIYHTATYYLDDVTDNVGKLMRLHWSSAGANETTLVGQYIYYDPDDPANTSQASYQNPELTFRIVSVFNGVTEKRDYKIVRRPNFNW